MRFRDWAPRSRGSEPSARRTHRVALLAAASLCAGFDGLDQFIGGAQQQFDGLVFSLNGAVDGHHDIARFAWHLGPAGAAEPLAIGFDVITVEDGKISRVQGFLDKTPG